MTAETYTCTDGLDTGVCPESHWRTEDGRWVHSREAAATMMVTGHDGREYGPFTPREVAYGASFVRADVAYS